SDDVTLIDVREPDEWAAGRAAGAIHVPLGDVPNRLADLPSATNAVIICRSGGRSAQATAWLLDNGYACRNLSGGTQAYFDAGLPMEADGDAEPRVV
ncbi:MAG TPA: rhodanese-like domain-containing protein, partial [Micromonosporaceae bacterium]